MVKKLEKYCRNRFLGALVTSFLILPLTVGAGQFSDQAVNTARQKLRTEITYSCVETPIEKVLMDLADKAKIDIIKSPEVTGNVTVKLTEVPLEEALTNILAVYNYTYIATENMVRVIPLPETAPLKEPQVTRIYKITYADANQVFAALGDFVTGKAELGFNKGTGHIMVTDKEEKIKAIDKFIEQIDHITSQVLVEVRIYDVSTKEGFELSPQWHIGRNAPYTADTILLPADEVTEIEVGKERNTFTEEQTEIEQVYQNYPPEAVGWYDRERRLSDSTREGWDHGRTETEAVYDTPPLIMSNWRRREFVGGSFDRVTGGSLNFSVLNDAIDLNFALTVLHSQVEARLLANPRILVLDNETAKFEIVREFPYRELLQVTREDPMSYTDFKEVGVDLKVTPHIARDGMLRLNIKPEFSVLVSREALSVLRGTDDLGNMSYVRVLGVPVVDARRLETTAMIKDGQTIAIGGLRKMQTSKEISKVPVLGDIPLIKGLFRSVTETEQVNELVVFITTRIVTRPELLETEYADRRADDILKKFGQTREEIGRILKPKEDPGRVIQSSQRQPEAIGTSPELTIQLAYAYLKMQRFELAKETLTSVIQLQPFNNTAYQYLGYCHLKLGDLDKAIESYYTAIKLDDSDWEAHRGLGVAYMLRGRGGKDESLKARAVEQWRISLDIKPDQLNRDVLVKMIDAYSN